MMLRAAGVIAVAAAVALAAAWPASAQQRTTPRADAAPALSASPSPSPMPSPAPSPVTALSIRDAVKATVDEMPRLPPPDAKPDFSGAYTPPGATLSGQAAIDKAFTDAVIESCWGSGALKHNPPVVNVGGLAINLEGLAATPHLFYAAATGKCK